MSEDGKATPRDIARDEAMLSQQDYGLLDTGEKFLSTNPGTQIEIGVPWGMFARLAEEHP